MSPNSANRAGERREWLHSRDVQRPLSDQRYRSRMRHERWNRSRCARGLSQAALGVLACVASAAWRPLSAQSPLIHLDLNLPAYRLEVFLRHERVRSYPVLIGGRGTRTPTGTFFISRLEWTAAPVGTNRECGGSKRPRLADPKGSLAAVQLPLSSVLSIRGTARTDALGTASAQGCVGLANSDAIDLATLIQRAMLGNAASDSLLAIARAGVRPLAVKLHEPIPIDIRYQPMDVVGDTLFAYPDPYRLGTSPWKDAPRALARADLDTMAIDRTRLRRLTRYPERIPVALPIRR